MCEVMHVRERGRPTAAFFILYVLVAGIVLINVGELNLCSSHIHAYTGTNKALILVCISRLANNHGCILHVRADRQRQ